MKSFLQKVQNSVNWLFSLNLPLYASYTGFFIVLSVFPALLLVLSALRYTSLEVGTMLEVLQGLLPDALMGTAERLIYSVYNNSTATVAGVSALTALWSSSRGIHGLLVGLNAIYGVSENRSYIFTRALSIVYTLLFDAVILLTLVLHVFGNTIISALQGLTLPGVQKILSFLDLRFFVLLAMQSLLFTLMYMILPNRRNRFFESLPGGLLASMGWLLFSNLYSIYVTNFPSYANIYGSVYAIAISMLWLYFCMIIFFFGGAINKLLQDRRGMER